MITQEELIHHFESTSSPDILHKESSRHYTITDIVLERQEDDSWVATISYKKVFGNIYGTVTYKRKGHQFNGFVLA